MSPLVSDSPHCEDAEWPSHSSTSKTTEIRDDTYNCSGEHAGGDLARGVAARRRDHEDRDRDRGDDEPTEPTGQSPGYLPAAPPGDSHHQVSQCPLQGLQAVSKHAETPMLPGSERDLGKSSLRRSGDAKRDLRRAACSIKLSRETPAAEPRRNEA